MRYALALFGFCACMAPLAVHAQVPDTVVQQRLVLKAPDITFQDADPHASGRTYGTTYQPSHGVPSIGPFTPQIYTYKTMRGKGFGDDVKIHHDFRMLYDLGDGKSIGVVGNGLGGVIHF